MNPERMNKYIVFIPILFFIAAVNVHLYSANSGDRDLFQTPELSNDKPSTGLKEKITFQSLPPNFDYNGIRCILKDYKGYMWFATEDGLVRYDGINLYLYENDPEDSTTLSYTSVNAIVEDKNKNLWVGTSIGLNLYNRDEDNFIRVGNLNANVNRLNNNYISALCSDNKSLLWIGTYGDGVNVFDPLKQSLIHYSYNTIDTIAPQNLNRVTCIVMDSSENIWLGTQNGLHVFSKKSDNFRHFFMQKDHIHSLSSNTITSLAMDLEGNIWVGTRGGGLNKLIKNGDDFLFKHYSSNSRACSLSSNFILSLDADRRGYLWIGSENGGLNRLNINSESIVTFMVEEGNSYSINSNSIWSIYNDSEGRIWIGSFTKGINVIDEKFNKFVSYQKNIADKYSLPDNDVKGFAEDNEGNVWVATDGGGICRFNPLTRRFDRIITNSEGHNYLVNNAVQTILFDSKRNELWIGTWAGGVDRLNKNGVRIENYKLEIEKGGGNNNIINLYEDSKGSIWAGTAGSGLFKYNTATNKFNQVDCSQQSSILTKTAYITGMLEDSDGSIWIGTLYGTVSLTAHPDGSYTCKNFLRSNDATGLSSYMVHTIFKDNHDRIWFGTGDNGLDLFNRQNSTFTTFQKKDGLPSNSIESILEDDEGYLWISTKKGISRFNYDSVTFTNYTRDDGLNSNEFYIRSALRTKRGEFYLGGENGFNVFYPENIKKNTVIPPVYFTNLKINNITAEIGGKNSPLTKCIGETTEITLTYKQSSFTIEFVALNYTRSSRNQFAYKLEGFESDWNDVGTNRSASFTNIKPGKYVFLVKGSNNDGVWNNTPTALLINIKPPFWNTWWAILIYVILVSLLIFLSLRVWNERIHIKHQLRLEQMGREKEHELNEANIQFFTNISHEFRTPLSLIIAPLESIILSVQSKFKEQLVVIYRNAQRLLQLTNNLMDFRKLEEGNTTLKVKHGDIAGFVKEVSTYFIMNSQRRHISFSVDTDEKEIQAHFDPEKLETILLNLLSNAFKFTPEKGKIRIKLNILTSKNIEEKFIADAEGIQPGIRYAEIAIIDNGSGINPEELPFIFNKFYQSRSQKSKKGSGTGIGLTLTRGLVELHHGFIKAESIPDRETRFTVVIPIDQKAYSDAELVFEPTSILNRTITSEKDENNESKNNKEIVTSGDDEERPAILIVEDNHELRSFLANKLGQQFNISQAEDGKIGIELALNEVPDLIVSDILMPHFSGIELCKIIKTDIRTCHIPIILLTAKTTISDQIEGVEIGADAYITKPFNMHFLFAQINQLIQSRRKLYAHFSQDVYMMPNKLTDNEMDQKFVQKAIDYIIENIADNTLNVEGLAEAMNLSRSNVYRKIKALTGNTIIEFIRMVRLKQALKLMETKKYSLAEIAYLTGFTSPSYFTKSFKDHYGKPPSEYMT